MKMALFMQKKYKIDLRARHLQSRNVREGDAMHLQNRTNIINLDGSIEYGKWVTHSTATNYGQCFDRKNKMEGLQYLVWFMGMVVAVCIIYTVHSFLGWAYS